MYFSVLKVTNTSKSGLKRLLVSRLIVQLVVLHVFISDTGLPLVYSEEQLQSPATYEQPFASILYTTALHGKALLPCDITPSTIDDQVVLILWYKDDELTPIFTIDARRGSLEHARILSSHFLEGRAHFDIDARPSHLQIEPIQANDEGDYRCRVDFKKGRTVNTVIALKVIVPPQEPQIIDSDGNELSGIVGPYNEGDELILICITRGGKPRPTLSWWKDYAIIDDSYEFDDKEVTTNQLTISPLSRHHLLSILMCQAVNNNITSPTSTSITLDMNLKPIEVRITQLTPILVSHTDALFECITVGSRPMPTLHWVFEGKRYDTRAHGEQQTSTTLTITVERQHRGETLECVSENLRIPNSAISDQIKLDVHYPPQLLLKLGTTTMSLDTIQEGIDIYFDCHIDANPRPNAPIVWIFNGNVLHSQQGIIESNQSLVLQRVIRSQSGTYQCQSSNQHGTALSNPIVLRIKFAPVCSQPYKLVYGVSLHETVVIDCDVDANPAQVSFQWKFESYTNLATFSQINDSSSVLSYTPHASQEYGTIECIAKNSIGIQRDSCKYLIIPYSAPQFQFNCHVINQTDTTMTISCSGSANNKTNNNYVDNNRRNDDKNNFNYPYNNNNNNRNANFDQKSTQTQAQTRTTTDTLFVYPPTYYFCEIYRELDMKLVENVSIRATERRLISPESSFAFNAKQLPPQSALVVRLFAKNSKGLQSTPLQLKARTLKAPEKLQYDSESDANNSTTNFAIIKRLRGEHLIIALLIGAALVAVIVIALGVIAVFRVRYSSSSIQLTPDGNDDDRELPPAETMLDNETDDDCRSDETLLKCGNNSMQMRGANESALIVAGMHDKSGKDGYYKNGKGPPDIIPVPYFVRYSTGGGNSAHMAGCDDNYNDDGVFGVVDDDNTKYRSNNAKPQDFYTNTGRVYVYSDDNSRAAANHQLMPHDYHQQSRYHFNINAGSSKQMLKPEVNL